MKGASLPRPEATLSEVPPLGCSASTKPDLAVLNRERAYSESYPKEEPSAFPKRGSSPSVGDRPGEQFGRSYYLNCYREKLIIFEMAGVRRPSTVSGVSKHQQTLQQDVRKRLLHHFGWERRFTALMIVEVGEPWN